MKGLQLSIDKKEYVYNNIVEIKNISAQRKY
jgi:hypothetical protein